MQGIHGDELRTVLVGAADKLAELRIGVLQPLTPRTGGRDPAAAVSMRLMTRSYGVSGENPATNTRTFCAGRALR